MRLLNIHSLAFSSFHHPDVPRYAIASHRWNDVEASLDDVQKSRNTTSLGYKKVEGFCAFIREHFAEIHWVWIDTCCIDHKSSQELHESINSMFVWYQNAAICLAYLADVRSNAVASGDERMNDFLQSTWFTRGWTLQELIAPQAVIFLTHQWEAFGHKGIDNSEWPLELRTGSSLVRVIATITGIPESVLNHHKSCMAFSVDERFEWTKGRMTTRQEDIAYCLLGIFGVHMPMIYGEGEENARDRLMEAIGKNARKIKRKRTASTTLHLNEDNVLSSSPIASDYEEHRKTQMRANIHLIQLKTVNGAIHNAFTTSTTGCLEGTRTQLLQLIMAWADDTSGKTFFWLCGKAGTGKSTVANTIANRLYEQSRLGASFFFSRGEDDRAEARRFFPTIVSQLASTIPALSQCIATALDTDPLLCERSLQEQFKKLLFQPLVKVTEGQSLSQEIVLVIDALDECESNSDIRTILELLAQMTAIVSLRVRVFVSSRPELPIELKFKNMSDEFVSKTRLEDIPVTSTEHDICAYFEHGFAKIREGRLLRRPHDPLPEDWPTADIVQKLVKLTVPLFISAATILRFVSATSTVSRLEAVLRQEKNMQHLGLDQMYLPILENIIQESGGQEDAAVIAELQEVVGPIVLLADPLSIRSLSSLLGIEPSVIDDRLEHLHSVLSIPPDWDSPVRILHHSFREFLIEPQSRQKHRFQIDKTETHEEIAKRSICLLDRPGVLKEDICDVKHPGFRRVDISVQRVNELIAPDVAYACRFWVMHLAEGGQMIRDDDYVHDFLRRHFLHWMEALGWLGRLSAMIAHIHTLKLQVHPDHGVRLLSLIDDARRFVLRTQDAVDLAPLQLYSSALIFVPTQSLVRQQFEKQHRTNWLGSLPDVPLNWSPEVEKLEGFDNWVNAVAFSPDGQVLAWASHDKTIRMWNTQTGREFQKLEGHTEWVNAVAFSPNGQLLALSSSDKTVRIWSTVTGNQVLKLEGHTDWVNAVAFSPDGHVLASASADATLRIWDTSTGDERWRLEGHDDWVHAVSFSPKGHLLASASDDKTVRIWNVTTGTEVLRLDGHEHWTSAVAFSPDGQLVASSSLDKTIRLWDVATGKEMRKLEVRSWIKAVSFFPSGQVLAAAAFDKKVLLLDVMTGQQIQGPDRALYAMLSSSMAQTDGSVSDDENANWQATIGDDEQQASEQTVLASQSGSNAAQSSGVATGNERQPHEREVLAFFADGELLTPAPDDRSVRLWNANIDEEAQKRDGAEEGSRERETSDGWFNAVALSPDGQRLASASTNKTVQLWDSISGKEMLKLEGHDNGIEAVAFSRDGQLLAAASSNGLVRLWNTITGEQIHHFRTGRIISEMSFEDGSISLKTDAGKIYLTFHSSFESTTESEPTAKLAILDEWIQKQNEDLLWLPHEYRGPCTASHRNMIAMGHTSGVVSFLRFCATDGLNQSKADLQPSK